MPDDQIAGDLDPQPGWSNRPGPSRPEPDRRFLLGGTPCYRLLNGRQFGHPARGSNRRWRSRSVLIATGQDPRLPGPGEGFDRLLEIAWRSRFPEPLARQSARAVPGFGRAICLTTRHRALPDGATDRLAGLDVAAEGTGRQDLTRGRFFAKRDKFPGRLLGEEVVKHHRSGGCHGG